MALDCRTSRHLEAAVDGAALDRTAVDWAAEDWAAVDWAAVDWQAVDWPAVDWPAVDWPVDGSAGPCAHPDTRPARNTSDVSNTPAPAQLRIPITVHAINERTPGSRWKALFDETWPAYRAWYLAEPHPSSAAAAITRPDLETATAMLAEHMPQLVPTYERLVDLAGDDEVVARMLTLWNAPAFLPACSQAVLTGPVPTLSRNYDYSPDLWERTIYTSAFTGRRVIGTGDCLWGLLDGMNDTGLAVSLTFGGRPGVGEGFAIPLVVRYLLEVAGTAGEAKELLRGLPIAMSYNLTVVDAEGGSFTAFVAPGQEPEFSDAPAATNHRGLVPEYPERAASLRSVARLDRLTELVATQPTSDELIADFGRAPLYNTEYSRAFGTLYTVAYLPTDQAVEYRWPDMIWRRSFDDPDDTRTVTLIGS